MIPRDRSNTYNIHTTTRYTKDIGKLYILLEYTRFTSLYESGDHNEKKTRKTEIE